MKSRIDKLEYSFEIDFNNKYYFKNNKIHRDKDLPAFLRTDGSRFWWNNGKKHRDNNKPSSIYSNGMMEWYENGKYIRDTSNEIKIK